VKDIQILCIIGMLFRFCKKGLDPAAASFRFASCFNRGGHEAMEIIFRRRVFRIAKGKCEFAMPLPSI
jgi:hypothetical protein